MIDFKYTFQQLPNIFFTHTKINYVDNPKLTILNTKLCKKLLDSRESNDLVDFFSGNAFVNNEYTISQSYAGHQFGHFTMLGDGRNVLLGEISIDNELYDIVLKGSGRTSYSRSGDGLAAYNPMIIEYVFSEYLFSLNIPTTRSLAITLTNTPVYRDEILQGAILTRVAKSHIRFGTFEFAYKFGNKSDLTNLADYVIQRHYPKLLNEENKFEKLYQEIIKVTAKLVASWQSIGFVHGVMNTDNMSISGETLDFGPCAFLDYYQPNKSFSSIDYLNRYSYSNQPEIARWNLKCLGIAFSPILDSDFNIFLNEFDDIYNNFYLKNMYKKLGIINPTTSDTTYIYSLLEILEKYKLDYTTTFLYITYHDYRCDESWLRLVNPWTSNEDFMLWFNNWKLRVDENSYETMKNINPLIIPRNHLVKKLVSDITNDNNYELFNKFIEISSNPFEYNNLEALIETQELPPENFTHITYCGT